MKLSLIFTSIVALLTSVHSQQQVNVNSVYGNGGQPVLGSGLTCEGVLLKPGYGMYLWIIPIFPFLGGGPTVGSSPDCVVCVEITYPVSAQVITALLINYAAQYEISDQAMEKLVGEDNDASTLADVQVTDLSNCNYPFLSKFSWILTTLFLMPILG